MPSSVMSLICFMVSAVLVDSEASTLLNFIPIVKLLEVAARMRRMIRKTISARFSGVPPNSSVRKLVTGERN